MKNMTGNRQVAFATPATGRAYRQAGNIPRQREDERGFILLTMLVIMSVMMGVAMGMMDSVDNTTAVVNYAKRATYARLAAMSAFNYASGILVADANGVGTVSSTSYDALNEDWFTKTHTTAGADAPYMAFTSTYGNGYFVNIVYDLSGRIPCNSTDARCTALIAKFSDSGIRGTITNVINNTEKTPWELNELTDASMSNIVSFTPYASSSTYKLNLNTIGQLGVWSGGHVDDIAQAVQSAGGATQTGTQRLILYRRSGSVSGSALSSITTPSLTEGNLDYNVQRVFTSDATLDQQISMASNTASYHSAYTLYCTTTSEGYFMIKSSAFISTAAAGAQHSAENRALSVVKRSSTGFTTLYFRWFWDDSLIKLQAY